MQVTDLHSACMYVSNGTSRMPTDLFCAGLAQLYQTYCLTALLTFTRVVFDGCPPQRD